MTTADPITAPPPARPADATVAHVVLFRLPGLVFLAAIIALAAWNGAGGIVLLARVRAESRFGIF